MSAVLGVSVGASAVRMATRSGVDDGSGQPAGFHQQAVAVASGTAEDVAAQSIGVLLENQWHGTVGATGIVCGAGVRVDAMQEAMNRQQLHNYRLVPEPAAVVALLESVGQLGPDTHTLVLYDLGSTGLTITVVDRYSRAVVAAEHSDVVGGDRFDAMIADQQLRERGLTPPVDAWAAADLTAHCRTAKEQLSAGSAACVPSDGGLILLNRERFDALIRVQVESSARLVRDVVLASGRHPDVLVLLGGGSRIPLVQSVLQGWLALPTVLPPEPEMVAAQGASLLATPVVVAAEVEQPEPNWQELADPPAASRRTRGPSRRQLAVAGSAASGLLVVVAIGLSLSGGDDTVSRREPVVAEVVVEPTTSRPAPTTTTTTTPTPTPVAVAPVIPDDLEPATVSEPPPPPAPRYLNLPQPIQIEVPPGIQLPPGMVR